jgi:hypothetical protein
MLKQNARAADNLVLLFDESLNDELQKKRLDMHVRLWSDGVASDKVIRLSVCVFGYLFGNYFGYFHSKK